MDIRKIRVNDDYLRLGLICLSLAIIYLFIISPLGLNRRGYLFFQDLTARYAHSLFHATGKSADITIIAIDDTSLRQEDLKWPWPRAKFAELISRISGLQPRVMAVDISFVGKSSHGREDDQALAEAIGNAKRIVLASYLGRDGILVEPVEEIRKQASAVGFVNKVKDEYSVVRFARAAVVDEGRFKYSFEAKTAVLYEDIPLSVLNISGRDLFLGKDKIRLNWDGTFTINYTRKPYNFNTIPVSDIFKGSFDPVLVRDKLVMIGYTAESLHDIYLTPLGSMPGVVVSANALDNIINKSMLHKPHPAQMFLFLLIFTILVAYPGLRYPLILVLLVTAGTVGALFSLSVFALKANLELDPFGIIILLSISLGFSRLYLYIKSYLEKSKMLNLLIIDQDSGLNNTYYLLLKLQDQLKISKDRKELPALILLGILDEKAKPLLSVDAETRKELVVTAASIIKKYLKPVDGLLTRTGDFEFGIIVPGYKREGLDEFIDSVYQRINNFGLLLPRKEKRFLITAAMGICRAEDLEEKSAQLIFYAGEEGLNRAKDLTDKRVYRFDPRKEKITFYERVRPLSVSEGHLIDFVIEDLKHRNRQLLDKIEQLNIRINDLRGSYLTIISSLVKALEEKDVYTAGHSERVAAYSIALADKLNLPDAYQETLREAALLHDIGKIGIPDYILNKKGALSEEEMEIIKRHGIESVKILEPATFLRETIPIVLHHHEHYDGSGYPHGLTGERIPLGARIMAIADAFDAMTSGRTYNRPRNTEEAISIIRNEAGKQFDPVLAEKFIEVIKELFDRGNLR